LKNDIYEIDKIIHRLKSFHHAIIFRHLREKFVTFSILPQTCKLLPIVTVPISILLSWGTLIEALSVPDTYKYRSQQILQIFAMQIMECVVENVPPPLPPKRVDSHYSLNT